MKSTESVGFRRRLVYAVALSGATVLSSPLYVAAAEGENPQVEEILITGSYIKRDPADSPVPLSVVSAVDIENNHSVDMQEVLTRIPYQSGGYVQAATFTGGGFQGRLPINLRNLGDVAAGERAPTPGRLHRAAG